MTRTYTNPIYKHIHVLSKQLIPQDKLTFKKNIARKLKANWKKYNQPHTKNHWSKLITSIQETRRKKERKSNKILNLINIPINNTEYLTAKVQIQRNVQQIMFKKSRKHRRGNYLHYLSMEALEPRLKSFQNLEQSWTWWRTLQSEDKLFCSQICNIRCLNSVSLRSFVSPFNHLQLQQP